MPASTSAERNGVRAGMGETVSGKVAISSTYVYWILREEGLGGSVKLA